jgi:DNA-directed RNA polymerase sigma subunit (sigma70/sigma32)
VHNNLKGLNRFVKKHQNFTRIVETQANKIGDYQRAKGSLSEELGREPTTLELSDRLKMSFKKVGRMEKELRKDSFAALPSQDLVESNPFEKVLPIHREVIEMLPYELTIDEQKVFNHLFGRGGNRKDTSTGGIARKLGWSDSKVSQIKKSVSQKYLTYMDSF